MSKNRDPVRVRIALGNNLQKKLTEYRARRRSERGGRVLQVPSAVLELLEFALEGVTPEVPLQDRVDHLDKQVSQLFEAVDSSERFDNFKLEVEKAVIEHLRSVAREDRKLQDRVICLENKLDEAAADLRALQADHCSTAELERISRAVMALHKDAAKLSKLVASLQRRLDDL